MAVLARGKALKQPGSVSSIRHGHLRRSRLPVASAVRTYWTCRNSNGRSSSSGMLYSYMRPYPHRSPLKYDEHISGLDYSYMTGVSYSRSQFRRKSSNWAPEDEPKDTNNGYSRGKRHGRPVYPEGRDPWETRTRLAGERYLRLMETHMKMLKKDPYWGLFGGSELRGVWNPWRKYYEMHKVALGQISKESSVNTAPQAPAGRSQQPGIQVKETQAEEQYRFDPITNKKVLCEKPKTASIEVDADHLTTGSQSAAATSTIPVKIYKPSETTSSVISPKERGMRVHQSSGDTELAGFARQPWLVQEGFIRPSQKIGHLADKERSTAVRKTELEEHSLKLPKNELAPSTSEKTPMTSSLSNVRSTKQPRLTTALDRSLERKKGFEYNERPDKREDLDLLRASDIRARSGKLTKPAPETVASKERRWEDIEAVALKIFKDREERLNREFAADRWELKRNFKAYPGEIAQTFEEKRAQRRLLERSFNSSLNKFEFEFARALGIESPNLIAGNGRSQSNGEQMNIHSYESMRTVAKHIQTMREELHARYNREALEKEKMKKREAAENFLLKEVDEQRAAMAAYENSPRTPKTTREGGSHQDQAGKQQSKIYTPVSQDKRVQEAALIEEIRSIYEDSNGTIDPNQRSQSQPFVRGILPGERREIQDKKRVSETEGNEKPAQIGATTPDSVASQQVLEASIKDFETLMQKKPLQAEAPTEEPPKAFGNQANDSLSAISPSESKGPARAANAKDPSRAKENLTYLLLAYDKSEDRIRIVRTSSSKYEMMSARKTVDSILSRLKDPIPYLDYMERLERSGYELVAGSQKMLVYKDRFNRAANEPLELDAPHTTVRGWGSPAQEVAKNDVESATLNAETEPAVKARKGTNQPSRRIRRMEEKFSGPGPRFLDDPAGEEAEHGEKRRHSRHSRVIRVALAVVGLVYACGVTLEWMKEREKQRLVREYQQEVQRVKDIERQRAIEERNSTSLWGF